MAGPLESTLGALVQTVVPVIELAGVAIIVASILISSAAFVLSGLRQGAWLGPFRLYRATLGRGILLGLEMLVAADIINTVAVEPTLRSVVVLGAIVLIRTFLSFSLEVEIEGRWPWRGEEKS